MNKKEKPRTTQSHDRLITADITLVVVTTLLGLAGPLAGQGSRGYRRIRAHRSPSR